MDIDDCVDKDYEQNNVKPLHIFVIDSKESEQKKGCMLPRSKMANSDVARIVNSDGAQSVVRLIETEIKWKPLKKTSLNNLGALSKLNPYAKIARRNSLFAEVEHIKTTEEQLLDVATPAFGDEAEVMEKTMLPTRHRMLQVLQLGPILGILGGGEVTKEVNEGYGNVKDDGEDLRLLLLALLSCEVLMEGSIRSHLAIVYAHSGIICYVYLNLNGKDVVIRLTRWRSQYTVSMSPVYTSNGSEMVEAFVPLASYFQPYLEKGNEWVSVSNDRYWTDYYVRIPYGQRKVAPLQLADAPSYKILSDGELHPGELHSRTTLPLF
ncbi:hypothetical protein SUGI_1084040 [Cryptomeria japonica]|nr:hypothetical protein SUGI_1084040 [Cryptomeria japonica]